MGTAKLLFLGATGRDPSKREAAGNETGVPEPPLPSDKRMREDWGAEDAVEVAGIGAPQSQKMVTLEFIAGVV